VFSEGSVLRGYKRAQSEDEREYRLIVGRKLSRILEMAVEGD
jgi:hypothetical protein